MIFAPMSHIAPVRSTGHTREMSHHILGISGSLRRDSSNSGLVRRAQELTPAHIGFPFHQDLAALPFYNEDLEDPASTPQVVKQWRHMVQECDALFIAAPEYNFGPSAVLKNAIDWATRPMGAHVLSGKVVSLVSSSGSTGGSHMIEQIGGVLGLLGNTIISEPNGQIAKGAGRIAPDGTTDDAEIDSLVRARMDAIIANLASNPR